MNKNDSTNTLLCNIKDIPEGESKGFTLNGQSIFGVKKQGVIYVYKNQCPHLGVEMEWQDDVFLNPDNSLIQCSMHGALFIIEDGSCISGPCAGGQLTVIESSIFNEAVYIAG